MIAHRNVGSNNWKKPESNGDENRIMRMIVGMRSAAKKWAKQGEWSGEKWLWSWFLNCYSNVCMYTEGKIEKAEVVSLGYVDVYLYQSLSRWTPLHGLTLLLLLMMQLNNERHGSPTPFDSFIYLFVQSHQSLMKFMNNAEQIECLKPHLRFQVINI